MYIYDFFRWAKPTGLVVDVEMDWISLLAKLTQDISPSGVEVVA